MKFNKIFNGLSLALFSSFALADKCDDLKSQLKNYSVESCVLDNAGNINTL